MRERIATFIDPTQGAQAQSYQLRQSLIAIGSGEVTGRGFGQGIQKFTYLPEPMGDSIFAVAGEELGFIGSSLIVLLLFAISIRVIIRSLEMTDLFARLAAIGIASYFTFQGFINIASMTALAPLTGIPLTFMSQGGSAMMISLIAAGLLLLLLRKPQRVR